MAEAEQQQQNQDELIIKQQAAIDKEISESIPLITDLSSLSESLLPEYTADTVYTQKLIKLAENYSLIRRTRPDGNCFFRAFCFGLFETLVDKEQLREGFYKILTDAKELLKVAGYTQFTVDDFYETFEEATRCAASLNKQELIEKYFTDSSISDYLVVFLRLLTSAELKKNATFYANFISNSDIIEFVQLEVEPMYKESDHIHIVALTAAFEKFFGVKVVYLDRGVGAADNSDTVAETVVHDFLDDNNKSVFTMLYRPGHYDLIYSN